MHNNHGLSSARSTIVAASLLILLALPSLILGQERVNRAQLELRKISSLSSATGWMLSPSGQWESGKNRIPWRLTENLSILKNDPKYALGTDNFKDYEFYVALIGGKRFVVFIKNYTTGSYAYPNIQEGWYDGEHTQAYALEIGEVQKLAGLTNGKVNEVRLQAFDYESVSMKGKAAALSVIKKNLGPQNLDKTSATLLFDIAPYKEKKITQFNIYNEVNISSMKIKRGTRDNPFIDGEQVYGSERLFDNCYYETSYDEFAAFLNNTLRDFGF